MVYFLYVLLDHVLCLGEEKKRKRRGKGENEGVCFGVGEGEEELLQNYLGREESRREESMTIKST